MSREARIELLLRVAEEQGQDASRALAHRVQVLEEAGHRLDELRGYRQEYAGGHERLKEGSLGADLQDHWRFMSRLNSAIAEHQERIDQQALAVEQSRLRWQETRQQVAVLEKVIERIRGAERRAEERSEQKATDERAGARRGSQNGGRGRP
jgi:flagellar protein FliJ